MAAWQGPGPPGPSTDRPQTIHTAWTARTTRTARSAPGPPKHSRTIRTAPQPQPCSGSKTNVGASVGHFFTHFAGDVDVVKLCSCYSGDTILEVPETSQRPLKCREEIQRVPWETEQRRKLPGMGSGSSHRHREATKKGFWDSLRHTKHHPMRRSN